MKMGVNTRELARGVVVLAEDLTCFCTHTPPVRPTGETERARDGSEPVVSRASTGEVASAAGPGAGAGLREGRGAGETAEGAGGARDGLE